MAKHHPLKSRFLQVTFLLVIILGSLTTNAQIEFHPDIVFTENQADPIDVKLDSILIVGIGTAASQIFLGDMSNKIIKKFRHKKIISTYFFLGQQNDDAIQKLASINKQGYKAILLFIPQDTAFFGIKKYFTLPAPVYGAFPSSAAGNYGVVKMSTEISRLRYQQTFEMNMFTLDRNMGSFWKATVEIDCNPRKERKSTKAANKLMDSWKKHKYIL